MSRRLQEKEKGGRKAFFEETCGSVLKNGMTDKKCDQNEAHIVLEMRCRPDAKFKRRA